MTTKQKQRKRTAKKPPTLRAQVAQLERELAELRIENRQLKRSLGALICKDDPVNLDLTPEDGVCEPSLEELIRKLQHTGK